MASCDLPEWEPEWEQEMKPWSWPPLEKNKLKSVYFRVKDLKIKYVGYPEMPRHVFEPTEDESFPSIFRWFVTDFKESSTAPSESSTTVHGSSRLSPISTMPWNVPNNSTAVAMDSRIYVVGGICPLYIRESCPVYVRESETGDHALHATMFFYDTNCPEKGWKQGPSMIVKRQEPFAAAVDGKLYVFGGNATTLEDEYRYAEVFDPLHDKWELLPPVPPQLSIHVCPLHALLLDTHGNKHLLFNPWGNDVLFSYNIDLKSWHLFDPYFGYNINMGAALDGVLYCYQEPDVLGYDLIERKWFSKPVEGLGQGITPPSCLRGHLLHIGDGKLCLIWGQSWPFIECRVTIHCTIFTVRRHRVDDEESILIAEVESTTHYDAADGIKLIDCLAL